MIHLHHGMWLNLSRQDVTWPGLPERFFAAGEEKTITTFPKGYADDLPRSLGRVFAANPVPRSPAGLSPDAERGEVDAVDRLVDRAARAGGGGRRLVPQRRLAPS